MSTSDSSSATVWKSIAAGAVGGLAASFTMNQFQALLSTASQALTPQEEKRKSSEQESSSQDDDATVKTAKAISSTLFDHELTEDEKKWAGPAVHYALGTTLGALYGGLAETFPAVAAGYGTAYGTAVWLGADELAVPALGLSQPPTKYPLSSHAKSLVSHLVYGLVTALTRKLILPND